MCQPQNEVRIKKLGQIETRTVVYPFILIMIEYKQFLCPHDF